MFALTMNALKMDVLTRKSLQTNALWAKAPKIALITGIVCTLGGLATSAHADSKHAKSLHTKAVYKHATVRHDNQRHSPRRDVIRLDVPVHVSGSARINLNRHLRHKFDIDPQQYRLRKVVVHNRSRHHGYAALNTGGYRSKAALHRGANHLRASAAGGRWMLGLNNARVNRVTVVLEPRRYAYVEHRRGDRRFRNHRWM